jgi:hypothetical protein
MDLLVGVVSSVIASILVFVGSVAWRNRKHRSMLSIILFPRGTVRVSVAVLLRIRVDENYVLFHTPRTPSTYGPLGGVVKFTSSARHALDGMKFRDEHQAANRASALNDLRGFIPAGTVGKFLRWLDTGVDREPAVECLRRELREELGEIGHPDLVEHVTALEFRQVRAVHEGPQEVPGKGYRQIRYVEVYELVTTNAAALKLTERLTAAGRSAIDPNVLLADGDEITNGRHDDKILGAQSCYLIRDKKLRQDLPRAA